MANSSRGIMKIPANDIASASSIESAVRGGATEGLGRTIEQWQGVDQLDRSMSVMPFCWCVLTMGHSIWSPDLSPDAIGGDSLNGGLVRGRRCFFTRNDIARP